MRRVPNVEDAIPKHLQAREKFRGFQAHFFETLAVPKKLLDRVVLTESFSRFCNLNQWRLDFPQKEATQLPPDLRTVLLVAYKILTRGRLTLASPFIEEKLAAYFETTQSDENVVSDSVFLKGLSARSSSADFWFDGEGVEKSFYNGILTSALGDGVHAHVLPQVLFSSLTNGQQVDQITGSQRVDFLITYPNLKLVVELDDPSHQSHVEKDRSRDSILVRAGFDIVRIPYDELGRGVGPNLQRLLSQLAGRKQTISPASPAESCVNATKLVHQVELSILEALWSGFLNLNHPASVYFDADSVSFDVAATEFLLRVMLTDFRMLLGNIGAMYGLDVGSRIENLTLTSGAAASKSANAVTVTCGDRLVSEAPTFFIQDIAFPDCMAFSNRESTPATINHPPPVQVLEYFLKYLFRHEHFLEGQYETVVRALAGKDTIVLLPTGSGKSLAFQLPALLLPGMAIVVDPILSLIDDQIDNLRRVGIDRTTAITGKTKADRNMEQVLDLFAGGEFLFTYVAPERFQMIEFRNALKQATLATPINAVVVDETHCVSEWGHDFRTAYLNLARTARNYCRSRNFIPPIIALTGTASHSVLKDVQRELEIRDIEAIITPKTFDRKELTFAVYACKSAEKSSVLKELLTNTIPSRFGIPPHSFYTPSLDRTNSGMCFCPWVNGDFGVVTVQREVEEYGILSKFYAGGLEEKLGGPTDWEAYKKKTMRGFKNNAFSLLVATKAAGMGLDKPNVRFTVHYGMPQSIEAFYQECGRAGRGRDCRTAFCSLILSVDDPIRATKALAPDASLDVVRDLMTAVDKNRNSADDITRALYFHLNAFKGVQDELSHLRTVLDRLGDLLVGNVLNIVDQERSSTEKSLHRLQILGVVSDYTIDFASNEFTVHVSGIPQQKIISHFARYVAGYNKGSIRSQVKMMEQIKATNHQEYVLSACQVLVEFIYETVERGRRRALREMLSLSEQASRADNDEADQVVRQRILRYLETSYSEELERLVNAPDEGFMELKRLIDGYVTPEGEAIGGIRSSKDAAEIRGQVIRYLESIPDHPALLMLRALSEAFCEQPQLSVIEENLHASFENAFRRKNVSPKAVCDMIAWALTEIRTSREAQSEGLLWNVLNRIGERALALVILRRPETTEKMLYEPAIFYFSGLSDRAIEK